MVFCLELTLSCLLSGSPSHTHLPPLHPSLVHSITVFSDFVKPFTVSVFSYCSRVFLYFRMLLFDSCPLWANSDPPLSLSPATIAGVTAVYMNYGLDHVKSSETGRLTSCPPALILLSLLLLLLQPQFDFSQVSNQISVADFTPL